MNDGDFRDDLVAVQEVVMLSDEAWRKVKQCLVKVVRAAE